MRSSLRTLCLGLLAVREHSARRVLREYLPAGVAVGRRGERSSANLTEAYAVAEPLTPERYRAIGCGWSKVLVIANNTAIKPLRIIFRAGKKQTVSLQPCHRTVTGRRLVFRFSMA